MKSSFFKVSRKRVAGCLIGAAAVTALGLSIGLSAAFAAPAGQCPRGQFFWKSKKSCIEKAEAAKLGLYHGPIPAAASASKAAAAPAPAETSSDAPAETSVAEKAAVEPAAPPQQASATLPPVFVPPPRGSLGPAAQPSAAPASQANEAPPGPSPYGELVIEEFAKAHLPEADGPISN